MFRIRKSFTFEAAHQLESSYTSECHECIHGHSYTVEMIIEDPNLDKDGMVVDFGKLKAFKKLIMDEWDHGLILHENKREWIEPLIYAGILKKNKVSFLDANPTAENMAMILFRRLSSVLESIAPSCYVEKVRVHETSTGWAEYERAKSESCA